MTAPNDARLLDLERQWRWLWDAGNAAATDEDLNKVGGQLAALADEIDRTPATGPDGLMVKFRRLRHVCGGDDTEMDYEARQWAEFEATLNRFAGRTS